MTRDQNRAFIKQGTKHLTYAIFAFFARLAMIQVSEGGALEQGGYDYYVQFVLWAAVVVFGIKAIELLILKGLLPLYWLRTNGPSPYQSKPHGSLFDFQISDVAGPSN